ncbi:MAG TPA: type II toxin-antitoxin system VapC family toxin [Anaerolineales bacterium]|nr:type II toxin-antitoxin system VapC family toxin [Anaerolineales bacterium]
MPAEILDSFALLAWSQDEPGADFVRERLNAAGRGDLRLIMPVINLGEVLTIVERGFGLAGAQAILAAVLEMPVEILAATHERVFAAAHIKANYPVSYADAVAIAAAQEFEGVVLTGDPEFGVVKGVVEVAWI